MNPSNHAVRWIAAGVTVLALVGAGTATATTEPPEPDETTMGTEDTSMTEGTEPMTGAGPSDCPAIAEEGEGSEAPAESEAAGTEADAAATTEATAESEAETTEATADTMAAETTAADVSAPPTGGAAVQIAETDEYGPILVDGACFTLYAFTQDVDGVPACVDDCAAVWPPFLLTEEAVPPLADELDPSLFGVAEHASGPMLMIGDWPLYYYADDTAPGDMNGQGVGGVWWMVAPDGTLIESEEGAEDTAEGSEAPAESEPADTAAATTEG